MNAKSFVVLLIVVFIVRVIPVHARMTEVNVIDWSPDGSRIATGHADGTVKIWGGDTGQLLKTIEIQYPNLPTEPLNILSLDWNPDATKLAIGATPTITIGVVLVIDPVTEQILLNLRAEDGTGEVAWSPDGKYLAASGTNLFSTFGKDALIIWDAATGKEVQRISGEVVEGIHGIAWSPDSTRIATGGHLDRTARIWEINSGDLLATMVGHADFVVPLDWSPDGSLIASVAQDNTLRVWDAVTGHLINTFEVPASGVDVQWSPDGNKIVTIGSNGIVQICDLSTGQMTDIFKGRRDVAWDSIGNRLVSGNYDGSITIQAAPGAPTLTPSPTSTTPTPEATAEQTLAFSGN